MQSTSHEVVNAIKSTFEELVHSEKKPETKNIPKNSLPELERIDDSSTASPASSRDLTPTEIQLRERDLNIARETVDKWMRLSFGQPKR